MLLDFLVFKEDALNFKKKRKLELRRANIKFQHREDKYREKPKQLQTTLSQCSVSLHHKVDLEPKLTNQQQCQYNEDGLTLMILVDHYYDNITL